MRAVLARVVLFVFQSSRGIWTAVIAASVLFAMFEFLVSRWLIRIKLDPNLHASLQACIVGLGAGVALWFVLLGISERRKFLADEVRRVAELNLTVRNSLELIVLSHYADAEHDHKSLILECTNRIDQKLSELFPVHRKQRDHNRPTPPKTGERESPGQAPSSRAM